MNIAVSRRMVPFDLAAIESCPQWRDGFIWPMSHAELKPMVRDVAQRYLAALWGIEDPEARRVGLLAARSLSELLLVVETAILVGAARTAGLEFLGGPPIVAALGGVAGTSHYTARASLNYKPIKHQFLRRAVRTASWSPWWRLPSTILNPDAVALSHNSLLRSEARHSGRAIGFAHAEGILSLAQRQNAGGPMPDIEPVLEAFCQVVRDTPQIPADLMQTCCDFLLERLPPYLTELSADLAAVQGIDLPEEIWCGSAGHRPVRTLALEVARRGGKVVVHDHAAAAGLFTDADSLLLTEFNIADRFVANTAGTAALVRSTGAAGRIAQYKTVELASGQGDPFFAVSRRHAAGSARQRKRVLYVVGAFDGQARRSPPSLNDPVKVDWWSRMAERLAALPIDIKVQAHPGGVVRGKPNPLAAAATLSSRRFEAMLDWADLLVIDITQSTTLTHALCTDTPIVLIEYGRNSFNPDLMPLIEQRCRTVKCTFDENNRVQIDPAALEAAVMEAPVRSDGAAFRALFAGRYA